MNDFSNIVQRWRQATKVEGCTNVLTLATGEQVRGTYTLTECGGCTPSHNALDGFTPSVGFPADANGQSVNDRDYYRDKDAQQVTKDIARNYDARAIQNPVIVSPEGVVLSGNGRTMAGELAAHECTDTAYIAHLRAYCGLYGLQNTDVDKFTHPRLVFVLAENLPYTASTFAKFNAQDMKTQNKTEQAIKYGKLVDNNTFGRIIATINGFETLGDFYACAEAVTRCINDLRNVGAIDTMSYAQMFDGDGISSTGKETLENVLIGKAFATNPDSARQITTFKSLRKSITFALAEISNNIALSEGYTLQNDLTAAIQLAYDARKSGYKAGERVSIFSRQTALFSCTAQRNYDEGHTILADLINDERVTMLKKYLTIYNQHAQMASNGQIDMFTAGGMKTKEEILKDVQTLFAKGTAMEQTDALKKRHNSGRRKTCFCRMSS